MKAEDVNKFVRENPEGYVILDGSYVYSVKEYQWYTFLTPERVVRTSKVPPTYYYGKVKFGADPEVFIVKNKKVVPSEKVVNPYSLDVVKDGFQAELHPPPSGCRQLFSDNMNYCLGELRSILGRGMKVSSKVSVKVTKDVFDTASPQTREFGCTPSHNPYEITELGDGQTERQRSAGGHIHLGYEEKFPDINKVKLVKVLDIVCGNTAVLIDRDKGNAVRRQMYGRAGEYREKKYGIEYRVPSNFWIRHYVLLGFILGQARQAVHIVHSGEADELIKLFEMDTVREARNTNSKVLARKNFNIYKQWLIDNCIVPMGSIGVANVDMFERWSKEKSPIKKLMELEPYTSLDYDNRRGFERFLETYYA